MKKSSPPSAPQEITQSELQQAQISWDDEGQPFSEEYNDVYFNTDSGIDESRFVFVAPSNLHSHWQQHTGSFTLVETGFGTGLNFLLTWLEWISFKQTLDNQTNDVSNHLHFISIEKFPLSKQQIHKALALFPELKELSDALTNSYPLLIKGFHSIQFAQHNLTLTLIFDDVSSALSQLNGPVDAWYLDGFAPAKNPDMWTDHLYSSMARLSRSNTTLATFTAAGDVRRGLSAAGFKINKVTGFGMKREIMHGTFIQSQGPLPCRYNDIKPWLAPTYGKSAYTSKAVIKKIAIIGAGIAGCTTAYALARRGIAVTLLDQHGIATEASGNPQGAMYAKLAAGEATHSDIYIQGYLQSLRWLHQHLEPGDGWDNCGLIQLASSEKEQLRQQKFIHNTDYPKELLHSLTMQEAEDISGVKLQSGGLFFPDAGWVSPKKLCEKLVSHPLITLETKHIAELDFNNEEQTWQLNKNDHFSHIVIACANRSQELLKDCYLPTKSIRGQLTYLDQELSPQAAKLKTVLCGKGYIAPVNNGSFCLGASYNIKDNEVAMRLSDHKKNLDYLDDFGLEFQQLKEQLTQQGDEQSLADLPGRTGFRCTTPDYLPMTGPLIDEVAFDKDFNAIRKNLARYPRQDCQFHSGLYLNIGHGSRGLTSAPLCAELIAAYICNENFPVSKDHAEALLPARFFIREMVRNKR